MKYKKLRIVFYDTCRISRCNVIEKNADCLFREYFAAGYFEGKERKNT
jgi:hypothetical protein